MRPAKRILLAGEDEEAISLLRFVLRNSSHHPRYPCYSVTYVPNAAYALEALRTAQYDVLLCQKPLNGIDELAGHARALDLKLKVIVLTNKASQTPLAVVDAILCRAPMVELLEKLKVLVERKRGPSLGYQKKCAGIVAREMAKRVAA